MTPPALAELREQLRACRGYAAHAGRLLDEVHEVFGWDPEPPRDFRRRQCSSHAGRNT